MELDAEVTRISREISMISGTGNCSMDMELETEATELVGNCSMKMMVRTTETSESEKHSVFIARLAQLRGPVTTDERLWGSACLARRLQMLRYGTVPLL